MFAGQRPEMQDYRTCGEKIMKKRVFVFSCRICTPVFPHTLTESFSIYKRIFTYVNDFKRIQKEVFGARDCEKEDAKGPSMRLYGDSDSSGTGISAPASALETDIFAGQFTDLIGAGDAGEHAVRIAGLHLFE